MPVDPALPNPKETEATPISEKGKSTAEETQSKGGSSMVELLSLPAAQLRIMTWIIRQQQASLREVCQQFGQPAEQVQSLLDALVERGLLLTTDIEGECRFCPCLQRRPRSLPQIDFWTESEY